METAIKEVLSIAKQKREVLENQKAPLWNKLKEICDSVKENNNTFVIYEYTPFSEITIICKKAKESSDKIAKLLVGEGYKYITIHRYLRDKENIISIDGKRVLVVFENDIQQTQTPYDDSEEAKLNVFGLRLLYLSRQLYNPSIFLDMCKKSTDSTQLLFLNSMLQTWKEWKFARNDSNIKQLEETVSGGRFHKYIVNKKSKEDYHSFILMYIDKLNEEKCVVCMSNKDINNLIITSSDMWKVAKKLKDKLNKKFSNGRDRFYYEISQNFIHNDFRLKRITFVDKKNNTTAFTLFNNLEYEALPCSADYKMNPAVEIRYLLYNAVVQNMSLSNKKNTDTENRVLHVNRALQLFKKIILEPEDIESVYYAGKWLDDKVEKIRLGGGMVRL